MFSGNRIVRIVLFVVMSLDLVATASSTPAPRVVRARKKAINRKKKDLISDKKNYNYIRTHDLNGDGVVDARDRLILANQKKDEEDVLVVLNSENEDIYSVMDANKDGNVDKVEMTAFYNSYDTNGDGVLEESEMETAVQ